MSCLLSTWYCYKEILAVGLCWFLPVRSDHPVGRKLLPSRGQLAPMYGSCETSLCFSQSSRDPRDALEHPKWHQEPAIWQLNCILALPLWKHCDMTFSFDVWYFWGFCQLELCCFHVLINYFSCPYLWAYIASILYLHSFLFFLLYLLHRNTSYVLLGLVWLQGLLHHDSI